MVDLSHTYFIDFLTNKRAELADQIFTEDVVHIDVVGAGLAPARPAGRGARWQHALRRALCFRRSLAGRPAERGGRCGTFGGDAAGRDGLIPNLVGRAPLHILLAALPRRVPGLLGPALQHVCTTCLPSHPCRQVWDPAHPTVGIQGMRLYLADLKTAFPDFWVEVRLGVWQ